LGATLAVRRVVPFLMVALAVAASVVQVVSGNVAWLARLAYVPLFVTLEWLRRWAWSSASRW
jgi:hypothetical protein